jgi:VCBS repeat-containing protein
LPTVTLSATRIDVLLGSQFSFTASFSNAETTGQAGFAPFIDLILPATGKDGAGAEVDDGITFVSATYLGQTVTAYTLTFDAAGNATHPLAKDATGAAVIVNAATYGARAGDQLVVLQLPYASVLAAQPQIDVVVTCQLSQLADTEGAPDLTVKARGGFEYGNDPAHNPTTDPSLFQVGTQDVIVHPTGLRLTQSINMPEGETVTGPNFERSVTITATPPPGQTLTNVDITQTVPSVLRFVSITPAAGGEVTSLTLAGGSTIVDPGLIQQTLALSPYLSAYTVRYASLSTAADTVLRFYVPEKDTTGASVLDPATGDDRTITFTAPTASGQWLPLDPRDQNVVSPGPPPVVAPATVTASGSDASFVAKSVALHKSVAIATNAGSAGLSPGDELQYSLNVDLSDYFMIGKTLLGSGELRIVDTLGDGQTFVNGSANGTLRYNGQQISVPLIPVTAPGASGTTTVTIDIAQALLNNQAIFGGALIGDLAVDGVRNGATHLVVSYRTAVAQSYATPHPQSEINEGDRIGNNATVDGTFLGSFLTLTGHSEDDGSTAALTVPTHTVATSIVTVNGVAPPANVELKPGDVVTFKLAYNLETGDYENFRLTAYLPLPLFDLGPTGSYAGSWTYGSGDTNADDVNSVTVGAGNSLVFDFGSYINSPDTNGKRIEVQFTLTVGNQPFADQRSLTVLGQSDQLTTIPTQQHLVSSGVVNIASVAEPVLAIQHGVVALGAGSAGVVSGTTGTWAAAGSTGAPFTGSITDLAAVDGSVAGIDGSDLVRLATAIENTGGLGAFDVATTVTLPAGFAFAGGSLAAANLAIHRGDGTALLPGTDYSVSGSTVTFLDAAGQPTLLPGRAGTAADASGANLVVITCDVVASGTIAASRNLQTNAALNHYSSGNGGPDFTPGADPRDTADQTVAAPVIAKVFANGTLTDGDSSAPHTTGANLVIGESMLYDIVVTLSEGTTQNLRVNDLVPAGMRLDTSFGSGGYQIITTAAASGALAADFAGAVNVGSASAPGGDGADLGLTLSAASAIADNSAGNNSFVVRVRLVAGNVIGNQAGVSRANGAQLIYSDPDGDTPNGSTPVDRTVALSGSPPSVRIVEPTTIRNDGGINAFDIGFLDTVPSQLIFSEPGFGLQSLTYAGGASNNGGPDFVVGGSAIASDPAANIDIPTGGSITLVVKGRVRSDLGSILDIVNTATAEWTSLDGATVVPAPGERSGVDGLLTSGVLNDYRTSSTSTVPVAAGATISHVGLLADTLVPTPDTSHPETVAVGELIYYRVAFLVPEGDTANASVVIYLPEGLSFAGDTRVALVDGGTPLVNSDVLGGLTVIPGAGRVDQDITDLEQSLLAADLSNAATAALRTSLIDTSDANAIKITLGNVSNQNNDAFFQMLYLDFFVRVDNIASVDTADNFNVSADFFSGTLKQTSTPLAVENIVEPSLRNLQKTVTDFNPNTAGATGTATVTLAFSNGGDGIAHDARLTDSVTGGSNYALSTVVINGTSYAPGSLPTGVTVSTAGGIAADFSSVAIGASIKLIYTVDVPNGAAIASTNATLDWSSLPETFTDGSAVAGGAVVTVGADGTASGERDDGGTTVPNTAPNTYVVSEGAGLGIISGTLWDDTLTPTTSTAPDGTRIAGQTVTLAWAGADGDLATTGDNRTYSAITDNAGNYHFGVLPSGNFRIDAATPMINHVFGGDTDNAAARIDSDGGTLGSITISGLGEGSTATAGVGYVRDNDAPVNTLPADQVMLEDATLNIKGIVISDIDASAGNLTVTLTVKHGTLFLTTGGTTGVTVVGGALDTATATIQGTTLNINTALDSLLYTPTANYNGTDTLTVTTNDRGNTGDANGNLMPNELADALTDTDKLTITITPVNDAPVANNDAVNAQEAGGWFNDIDGLPGVINVLSNDTDVDLADNPSVDKLSVSRIGLGSTTTTDVGPIGNTTVVGAYGTLKINSNGNTTYDIDDDHPAVQALRLSGNTLTETFTYEMRDLDGTLKPTATLTVTIRGANDTPLGVDDEGTVYEAGGVKNGTPGAPSILPNVLGNDIDVDSVANGETRNVTGIRYRKESSTVGVFTGVDATNPGIVAGNYGTLTMNYDGSYSYVVDQDATAVQRMVPGDTLIEYFSYVVTDQLGDEDIAQMRITINGANDNPVASDDQAAAQAQAIAGGTESGGVVIGGTEQGSEVNPTGNVILFQSRPGAVGPAPGNGIDTDVDRTDQPNSNLVVTGIRTGVESGGETTIAVTGATVISGSYGTLTINPDGSFSYDVDSRNATVQGLNTTQTLTDTFTYKIADTTLPTGLTDLAVLNVIVRGVNDPPVANDVFATAVEAGGIANGNTGVNPSGDATANDIDPEGDPIAVVAFRTGTESGSGTAGILGSALQGTYGALTLNANGTYTYVVDNNNAAVQALRTAANTLSETFTYQIADNATTTETDLGQIVITIEGRNDNPVGLDDTATAVEAGGLNNASAGSNPSGNVLTNDTDVDSVANGETRAVAAIRTGAETATGAAGTLGVALAGSYGSLTLNADGSYQYVVDNANAAVQALRTNSDTLTELFTYTVRDAAGATDLAQLGITIRGANDAPLASDDAATAVEAGGINNATPGSNGSGNVLGNDSDVDAVVNGETRAVAGFTNTASVAGTPGSALAGSYGSLTLNADGSYTYVVDNANAAVQGLRGNADTLGDTFTYTMLDTAGATSTATLTITIRGANDSPLASDDAGTAFEAGGVANGTPGSDATGDVLVNDTDVDNVAFGETKAVSAIRTGSETGSGTAGSVGSALAGTYGALTLNADGSYRYIVDNSHAAVQALRTAGDTLSETFTYTLRDAAGATDVAQLTITIRGANDTPLAIDDSAFGWPPIVGSPGSGRHPTGNVLPNDRDVDSGDGQSVSGIRTGTELPGGDPLTAVVPGTSSGSGVRIDGTWGWLNIGADGSYLYEVDFARTASLAPGVVVQDYFTYELRDTGGLTDLAQLTVNIRGRNNPPIAVPNLPIAVEAGGIANGSPGIDPAGDITANDFDFEGDPLSVDAIRTGPESGSGTAGTIGSELAGTYGWLTQQADGTFTYRVDNANPLVEALRSSGDTLTDFFTYTVSDIYGAADQATIAVTIRGANDNPLATHDTGTALEAGGLNNGTPGSQATGDVLLNDTDVDAAVYGETKAVSTFASGGAAAPAGSALTGAYGSLTLNADGSYTYVVDNTNATIQGLRTRSNTLTDTFTYTMRDAAGATSTTTLTITIRGANDNPLATHDTGTALEAGGLNNGTPGSQATGNVLLNDTDVDAAVYGETKAVSTFAIGGAAAPAGSALTGAYGTLTLNADGSYTYVVDNANTAVEALRTPAETLGEIFTYTVVDAAGATATATLTITIQGANDTPLAVDDSAFGWPPIVGSPGSGRHPTGNVLPNDRDVDSGDGQSVSGIRTGTELPGGDPLTAVVPGTSSGSGVRIDGTWGWLNIGADGSYLYEVDFARTASLAPGVVVQDYFTYELRDTGGLTDLAQLTVNIRGRNNPPIAVPNLPIAVEAGGIANGSPGIDPAGDITANDFDFEGDPLSVDAIRTGPESGSGTAGTIGSELAGTYGWLTQQADGTFTYRVDNANPLVEALRSSGDTLTDFFTYTVSDIYGAADQATIAVTIRGANDNPLATHDTGTAVEAGGLNNGTPGSQATGDVLLNDTDVDAAVYGETKAVSTFAIGGAAAPAGSALTGAYGTLTLNADGSYTYVVDNANTAVEALRTPAETLGEIFTYTVVDAAGATATATLTITIQGANDTPLAVDDSAFGWPPIVGSPGSGRHPTGNVLPNDRDVDSGDGQSVSGIRTGTELPGGDPLTAVVPGTSSGSGVRIDGTWGWLNIGADGSYLYEVDFARTASLAPGVVVQDYFTYELRDTGGLTDLAQLTVNIRGRNNPPIAVPNLPIAVEAGGIANGSPGIDPAGDITANDFDFEGDPLSVDAIRTGPESGSGTAGTIGSELAGTYGWLTQQADGTFTYRVDNANPLVEALRSSGDTLTDFFTYTVSDIYGAADQATIAVTIQRCQRQPTRRR